MSGVDCKSGSEVSNLAGRATPRGHGLTRRMIANRALIRHKAQVQKEMSSGTHTVWLRLTAWRLEWENAILRYRDGNYLLSNGKDTDDD